MQIHTFTEAGGHLVNEDAFLVQPHPADPGCLIVALADGQGGRAGGARAAQLACSTVVEAASGTRTSALTHSGTWYDFARLADAAVAGDAAAGFTTLVAYCVHGQHVIGASNGDSALLVMTGDEAFIWTKYQAKNPPVGSGEAAIVPFAFRLGDAWRLLGMTDGVWKYARWDRVIQVVQTHRGEEVLGELQALARLPGSGEFQDDFTVVLLASN